MEGLWGFFRMGAEKVDDGIKSRESA